MRLDGPPVEYVQLNKIVLFSPNTYLATAKYVFAFAAKKAQGWRYDQGSAELKKVKGRFSSTPTLTIQGTSKGLTEQVKGVVDGIAPKNTKVVIRG
jgi:hypothetical protein